MKTLKVNPGDVFAIFLPEQGCYMAGRVLAETNLNGYLVDIFERRYPNQDDIDPDDLGDALFEPILLSFKFTFLEKWKIVKRHSGPHEDLLGDRVVKFGFALPPAIWENGQVRDATPEEVSTLNRPEVWFPERLVGRRLSIPAT